MNDDVLPIYDLTPFTMLDFPDRVACIVWFSGCNMRCPYCHNPEIVKGKSGKIRAEDVMSFLKDRRGLLDGVVLSGGEATLYKGIVAFSRAVKDMGYAIKLDTNGTRPDILRRLLDEKLLDYVALDFKAPPAKFRSVTKLKTSAAFDRTLDILCPQPVPVEIRTTVHTDLIDESDILEIRNILREKGFRGAYYIQNYRTPPAGKTLGNLPPQTRELAAGAFSGNESFRTSFRNFSA